MIDVDNIGNPEDPPPVEFRQHRQPPRDENRVVLLTISFPELLPRIC